MEKVLLHICCGVCASYCIQELKRQSFYVEGIFFNPNIHPRDEYLRRKQTAKFVASINGIALVEDSYDSSNWLELCGRHNKDKEGGLRCCLCYELRLRAVFEVSKEKNFDYFTTTLTVSPHKKSSTIFEIAKTVGGSRFFVIDFKKNDGFKKTIALAKKESLYRQNYCGCEFSKKTIEKGTGNES